MDKATFRRHMRRLLDDLSPQARREASQQAVTRVLALPQLRAAADVFCFVSHGPEIETHDLIRRLLAEGKRVAVPWMGPVDLPRGAEGDFMRACFIERFDELTPGRFGILAPPDASRSDAVKAACGLALCPGLAFTMCGDRLGRGAGYYDRYLSSHPQMLTVGLCFDSQIVEGLPAGSRDVPMHHLVSEKRVIDCRRSGRD